MRRGVEDGAFVVILIILGVAYYRHSQKEKGSRGRAPAAAGAERKDKR